jgi:predicted Zn-dependent peptidase
MECKTAKLDNGLEIIAECTPDAVTMAAGFFVRTGSRDETPEVAGVSHFLEHMVFKGTERRSAAEVNLEFDRMGANYNAFTSEENTVYYASVLPEFQQSVLDLLCDMLRPSLRREDFDIEKGVILEEIAMYEDQPHFRLYDNLMTQHFADHPLGNVILGTPESITNMQRDDMQAYFDRRYSPTNVTLVATGQVDFDALVAQARELCSHWEPYAAPRDARPHPGARTCRNMHDAKLVRENLGLMSPAPSCEDEKRYAAELLANILGDSSGSRLYYALIEPALVDDVSTSYSPMDAAGGFLTFASCDPERTEQVRDTIVRECTTFCQDGPSEAELQAAKNKIASGAILKGERPMGRLTSVGLDWVYIREYSPLKEQVEKLFAVSRDEVLDLARQCEINDPTILTLGPRENLKT